MNVQFSNRWKVAFLTVVPALILLVIVCIYMVFDQSVTLTYRNDECERIENDLAILAGIFPSGSSRKDFVYLLRKSNPKAFIVEQQNEIRIGSRLQFKFTGNGKLESVFIDSEP